VTNKRSRRSFWHELRPVFGASARDIERMAERREITAEAYVVESVMVRCVEDREAEERLRGVDLELELLESNRPT